MNEQTIQLIEKYAAKLGTTSDKIFEILIQQAALEAKSSIIGISVFFFFILIGYFATWLLFKRATDVGIGAFIISSFALLIWATVTACSYSTIVTQLYNPHYWALQEIMKVISG